MNEKKAFETVRHSLKPRRFEHTERVVEQATKLAEKYGGDFKKIRMAAILHDYAKYRPTEEMRQKVMKNSTLPMRLLDYGDELLHSFVGAVYVKEELDIKDEVILSAIRYHTTGRAGMTLEEKIVFLADYIEPGRTFPEAAEARKLAEDDLDLACLASLKNTIIHLSNKSLAIYPDTFEAYNDFVNK
ncbi:phosphohydrolase [Salipaludibacillus keqinensis]|uniref:bis(5'-nucleosyl)-tetraphosphatase (symmetrical) n=1 Tax=Salipaludibacillus keqinensis TaxID=2045207 RepID=A0A323TH63_9BACI|nr:bis(5'-nucleosyl)-tetraphosphatase (symmetrical) YqeK [Salipaludibacillus keqinensis]PYZ94221.1 phosphohydrolase [Salipaludibacillus keqinensis]